MVLLGELEGLGVWFCGRVCAKAKHVEALVSTLSTVCVCMYVCRDRQTDRKTDGETRPGGAQL